MKKFKILVKTLSLAFAAVLLCASLSGCFLIDVLEAQQGFYIADNKIEYNEKVYRLLPKTENLSIYFGNSTIIYITDTDVPALASQSYGTEYLLSEDEVFLEENARYKKGIYCEESRYAEFAEKINGGIVLKEYCKEVDDGLRLLTEAEKRVLEDTIGRASTEKFRNEDPYMYEIKIFACSADTVFIDDEYRICEYEGDYYIARKSFYSDELYEWVYYTVSKVDYSVVEGIIA